MFNSHLLYCITIWTSTFSTHLNSIRILQNKAVKLLAGIHWRHSSSSGYKSLSILKLDDIIKLQSALFVHRHFNKKLSTNLQNYFTNVNTCHSIATRRQACGLNYHTPRYRSVVLKLGSAVLLGSARQIFWDREAPSKKIKTTILKKKFCVKLSFQATFLPINLTNTICHETLQAT